MNFQDGFQFYLGQFAAGLIMSLPIFAVVIGAVIIDAARRANRESKRKERDRT